MLSANQHPTFAPLPLPFLGLEGKDHIDHRCVLRIVPCPFCHRLFGPTWDGKIVSCKHVYHSWCALNHFFTSTKCFLTGYGQEIHPLWWEQARIKKLSVMD